MKKTRTLMAVLLVVTAAGWARTAEEIVRKMQANLVATTSRIRATMTVKDLLGTKQVAFVVYARGDSDALVEFTSPDEKGQKILRTGDAIYLLFPGADEVLRLQGAAFRDAVLGSGMSYEDLTGGKTLLESYDLTLEGRESVDGADCYRIAMKAKGRNVAYPRQVVWVDATLWSARKMEQYSLSNRLLKTISLSELTRVSGRVVPRRMVVQDGLKKNTATELVVEEIEIGIPLDASLFLPENLKH
jgi:outer membrane lipoprotein-sorting protein